jgi:hypothetical protein
MHPSLPQAHPEVRYPVLKLPRLEVCFPCGNRLWLRQVNSDPLVRAIEQDGSEATAVVNLSQLLPHLSAEVHEAAPLDRAAIIFFSPRLRFGTREEFLSATALH